MKRFTNKAHEFLHDLETKKKLQDLQQIIGGLNVFSILKTERTEIRHSNVLAWLIDSYGNHGLGTQFAEVFFVNISNTLNKENAKFISPLILHGLDDITVYREKDNIDILIVSNIPNNEKVIAIENKTGSGIHDDQLNRYAEIVKEQYPNHEVLFLYLDSNQDFNEDIGKWQYINYSVVKDTLQYFIDSGNLNDKLRLIITDYLTIIRRNHMNEIEQETQELCDGIYAKYRDIFDFILANKVNKRGKFFEVVMEYLSANAEYLGIVVNPNWCSGAYLRFAVKDMQVTGNNEKWISDQMILLELYCTQDTSYKILSLATYLGDKRDNEKIKKIWEVLPAPRGKGESNWRTYCGTGIKWNGDLNNENDKQKLFKEIESIINGKKMQDLFTQIKNILNENK